MKQKTPFFGPMAAIRNRGIRFRRNEQVRQWKKLPAKIATHDSHFKGKAAKNRWTAVSMEECKRALESHGYVTKEKDFKSVGSLFASFCGLVEDSWGLVSYGRTEYEAVSKLIFELTYDRKSPDLLKPS